MKQQLDFTKVDAGAIWKWFALTIIMVGGDPDIIDGIVKVLDSVASFIEAF